MKICIAQTKSEKGKLQNNISNHLELVNHAIDLKADLIVFPELSITNYEPELASDLALHPDNSIFDPFQKLSNVHEIAIGIGIPLKMNETVCISMLIFQSDKDPLVYSKQLLHEDELPYFSCGNHSVILNIKDTKLAFGICYETMQRDHVINSISQGIDVYIASVSKSQENVDQASRHFPQLAREFNIPILMSNSVGPCSHFISAGNSAIWNKRGVLLEQLDNRNQGLLCFDTTSEDFAKQLL